MNNNQYFYHLYEIATHLNKEFSLPAALRKALEKTVEALDLETGWIWLVEKDMKSVYLAASFNLPPALRDYPERLSGWCYCIDHYLAGNLDEATNISEIACSRLKDIVAGTRDMKFHATIPIITNGQKVGIINLLSREKQQLDDQQLELLNTLSELVGIAIQRTRLQDVYVQEQTGGSKAIHDFLQRVVVKRIEQLSKVLQDSSSHLLENQSEQAASEIQRAIEKTDELRAQIGLILNETTKEVATSSDSKIRYPASPLTPRELEVLGLVKKGLTNNQIASQLYIAERTVKFHLTSILSKLYAKTRTQAVDIALKRGLLSS